MLIFVICSPLAAGKRSVNVVGAAFIYLIPATKVPCLARFLVNIRYSLVVVFPFSNRLLGCYNLFSTSHAVCVVKSVLSDAQVPSYDCYSLLVFHYMHNMIDSPLKIFRSRAFSTRYT